MSGKAVFTAVAIGLSGSGLFGLGACAPTTAINGFQAVDNKPADIKPGTDTRSSVLSKLGSPSSTSAFDNKTWYYISQTTEKYAYYVPHVQSRNVVSIAFDKDDRVASVKAISLKDGFQIAYSNRETPTRGKELNWFEQILGTVGRGGGLLNQNQNDPGQRPGR